MAFPGEMDEDGGGIDLSFPDGVDRIDFRVRLVAEGGTLLDIEDGDVEEEFVAGV